MSYLRNTWYVAAWAEEVEPGKLFHRTLLDERVLMFRDSAGTPRAMVDRCPHRFAPLHMGKLCGDRVQCGYHGLEFDASGRCVHNPHGEGAIPAAAKVETYPLVERYSMLWIWMGDPDSADETLIPEFSFQDPEQFYVGKRYLHVRAGYALEIDNIMDLSHIQYLHPTTLGSDDVAKGSYSSRVEGNTVWSIRNIHAEIMPEFLYKARNIVPGMRCDRWIDVRWNAPANMALFVGAVPTGEPRTPEAGVAQAHVFTPETSTSSHYWFGISFPKSMGEVGARIADEQIEGLKHPFEFEDLPMLEAQQFNITGADDSKPILLRIDAGAVAARRVLNRLLAEEAALAASV